MPLDFSRIAKPRTAIVPVLGNSFTLHKKKYATSGCDDGWWSVEIEGNKARGIEPYYWDILPKGTVTGYTYNSDIVFSNFDAAKRKWGKEIKDTLHFLTLETFTAVRAVLWEDGRIYFCGMWYEDSRCIEIKHAYDTGASLADVKGVTPELKTLFVFHSLEREQVRALLAAQEAQAAAAVAAEEHRRRMADVGYRLRYTFENAGARLINFTQAGNRITVDWELLSGDYRYNSVLDANTFRVLEAGYCMSGADRQHTATSMVQLADDYEQRGVTYITRR